MKVARKTVSWYCPEGASLLDAEVLHASTDRSENVLGLASCGGEDGENVPPHLNQLFVGPTIYAASVGLTRCFLWHLQRFSSFTPGNYFVCCSSQNQVRGFCTDMSNPEVFEDVNVYGDIANCDIHHMWYGMYSYGHQAGVWTDNLMHGKPISTRVCGRESLRRIQQRKKGLWEETHRPSACPLFLSR